MSEVSFNTTAAARFEAKVSRAENGCLEWQAGRDKDGYGQFRPGGIQAVIPAHRAAWLMAGRVLLLGQQVLHSCDNPPCVDLGHLFAGMPADNSADMVAKGRQCRGEQHPRYGSTVPVPCPPERKARGERNGWAKLMPEQVLEIRRLYGETTMTQAEIGELFKTPQTNVSAIVRRRAWAHV